MSFELTVAGYGPHLVISKGFSRLSFWTPNKKIPYCIFNYHRAGPDFPLMPKWSLTLFNWKYYER